MLRSLGIRNYVLIDSLDIEFPEGLVIITGQTGAGKSILLGALSLLTGAKADAGVVGEKSDNCIVEAEFQSADESLRDIVEGAEADWNGGNLIISRMVGRNGRSRSFINDSPVNVGVLSSIAPGLIDEPRLAAYLERCIARPAFQRALAAQLGDFKEAA